jgi:hypothetical protein
MKNLAELNSVLDSPALTINNDHGILNSKIEIKIIGMMPNDNVQIWYRNTDAIDGNLIKSSRLSNIFKANTLMMLEMTLVHFETYQSIIPRQIMKPNITKHVVNY